MKPIWLIVANQTHARIFTSESSNFDALTEIEIMTHLDSRLHDRDMTSDLLGKIKSVGGGGHAYELPTDPKKHEADNFAHRVAKRLEAAHHQNAFEKMAIIAEPAFLGLLRHCLSEPVKKSIIYELDRNYVHARIEDIQSYLPSHLPC
jgi:protein required for attachment to host cells